MQGMTKKLQEDDIDNINTTHRSSSGPSKSEKVYSQHIILIVQRRLVEAQSTALSFPSPLSRPNTTFLLKKAVNWQQYQTPSRNS